MSATIIFSVIIAIVLADYLLERGLSFLNCRSIATQLPDEVKGIYSEEKYQQSQEYKRANCRFELVTASLQVVILLALLIGGGFAFIDEVARGMVQTELLVSLLFFALLFLASEILFLPFALYHTFVLEERFAFNKTTKLTFITDKIKGVIAALCQTGIMLSVLSLFIANPVLFKALGADIHSFHLALISFALLYSPLFTVMGLAMNSFSRKNEYEADRFAAHHFNAAALGSALKKLSVNNLSNLTPHPAYVFFHYSHPPLLQRLRAMSTT